jgi:hypothetical protein
MNLIFKMMKIKRKKREGKEEKEKKKLGVGGSLLYRIDMQSNG